MIPHPVLEKLLNWLLSHSLQAGALVLLVLAVQWLFRRQLTHRWRFALWWIVLVRRLLPFEPESGISLFNFFQPRVRLEGPRYIASAQPTAMLEKRIGPTAPASGSVARSGSVQPEIILPRLRLRRCPPCRSLPEPPFQFQNWMRRNWP